MSGISWIEFKGKKILHVKFSGFDMEEHQKVLDKIAEIFEKEMSVLILSDFNDSVITQALMQKLKEYGKKYLMQNDVKNAVLGVKDVKKILFSTYLFFTGDKNTKAFDTETEAKEWLVSQSK